MTRDGFLLPVALAALLAVASCKTKASAEAEPVASSASAAPAPAPPDKVDLAAKAKELAHRFIIVDNHIDVPWRLEESRDDANRITEDVSVKTPKSDFDWKRAMEGGLSAPFMSIYVPA